MNIGTREKLATAFVLAAIALIGAAIWWAYSAVAQANDERRATTAIVRGLTELRLVTLEFSLDPHERVLVQWRRVSERLDGLVAGSRFSQVAQEEIRADLFERRRKAKRLFEELAAGAPRNGVLRASAGTPEAVASDRFASQLLSQLVILQQDSLSDAFRLADFANERISSAQARVLLVIVVGLALIGGIKLGLSWLTHRHVLARIVQLQKDAKAIEEGTGSPSFAVGGNDEISQLGRSLDSMQRSLKDAVSKIEESNRELGALNKEIEAFSYSVSHDLRGPLRSMDGFSQALLEDYGDKLDEEGKDNLGRIRAASQRMGHLIDDLLGLSRVTRAELRLDTVNLSEMAAEIAAVLDGSKDSHPVQWRIQEHVTVRADRDLMRIALQNLLDNAWKFTGKTPQAVISVGLREQAGERQVFVADNGAGFDMAHADKLFGVFQRLHHARDFSGTGIGLAIVQRIVRRHGGRILAEARPGEGATFYFTLGEFGDDDRRQDHPAG
jgi:signal transduction histidine kinase